MTIIDVIFGIACVLLGFEMCRLYYEVNEKDDSTETKDGKLPVVRYDLLSDHFYDYDLSKQDFVITGDRHSDTIEKSISKNDFRHAKEYWKYTFEDGESKNSDHPLSNEEMGPLVDIHGPVRQDGLEVIKL